MIQVTQYGTDRKLAINPDNVFGIEDFGEYVIITNGSATVRSSDDFDDILNWMENHK